DKASASLHSGGDALRAATDKMVGAATSADGDANNADVVDADRAILLVRLSSWRFLATRDPAGPTQYRAAAERASQALDAVDRSVAPALRPLIAPVRDALTAYRAAFEKAST